MAPFALGALVTAGELVAIECQPRWVSRLLTEGAGTTLDGSDVRCAAATVRLTVEASTAAHRLGPARVVSRSVRTDGRAVVVRDAAGSGFDLSLEPREDVLHVVARWRPRRSHALAHHVLRSRFHLLARAALLQYPAMWWAGVHGHAPLHAPVLVDRQGRAHLLAGAGGVGKSTLISTEVAVGGWAASDNLSVSDGHAVFGVSEPFRVAGGGGRRMPHGRREEPNGGPTKVVHPDDVVVVTRTDAQSWAIDECEPSAAARALVAGTLQAGELRRYWSFAGALADATGRGPAAPPVVDVAEQLTNASRCWLLRLPTGPAPAVSDITDAVLARGTSWT